MEILIVFIVVFIIYVISEATGYMSSKGKEDFEEDNYPEELEKDSKGVSEPVITFVELVKNNPKRFSLKEDQWISLQDIIFIDKYLKIVYRFSKFIGCRGNLYFTPKNSPYYGNFKLKNIQNLDWVTDEEWQYINEHLIEGIYEKRVRRFNEIKTLRKEREEQREKYNQRQKVKDLYIKEEK